MISMGAVTSPQECGGDHVRRIFAWSKDSQLQFMGRRQKNKYPNLSFQLPPIFCRHCWLAGHKRKAESQETSWFVLVRLSTGTWQKSEWGGQMYDTGPRLPILSRSIPWLTLVSIIRNLVASDKTSPCSLERQTNNGGRAEELTLRKSVLLQPTLVLLFSARWCPAALECRITEAWSHKDWPSDRKQEASRGTRSSQWTAALLDSKADWEDANSYQVSL